MIEVSYEKIRSQFGNRTYDKFAEQVSDVLHRILQSETIRRYCVERRRVHELEYTIVPLHHLAALVLKQLIADYDPTPLKSWPLKLQLEAVAITVWREPSLCQDWTTDLTWQPGDLQMAYDAYSDYPKTFCNMDDATGVGGEFLGSEPYQQAIFELKRRLEVIVLPTPKYVDGIYDLDCICLSDPHGECRRLLELVQPEDAYIVYGLATNVLGPNHVWVKLPGGLVFDPVFQGFYDEAKFLADGYVALACFTLEEDELVGLDPGDLLLRQSVDSSRDPRDNALHILESFNLQ